jgi:hypothetical protein
MSGIANCKCLSGNELDNSLPDKPKSMVYKIDQPRRDNGGVSSAISTENLIRVTICLILKVSKKKKLYYSGFEAGFMPQILQMLAKKKNRCFPASAHL